MLFLLCLSKVLYSQRENTEKKNTTKRLAQAPNEHKTFKPNEEKINIIISIFIQNIERCCWMQHLR